MFYYKEKYVISFINYYISNFNNKPCFIHHQYDVFQYKFFDSWCIKAYLYTNNINYYEVCNDVDSSDIIIFTEKFDIRNRDFLFNIEKKCSENELEKSKRNLFIGNFDLEQHKLYEERLFENISLFVYKLNSRYMLLDEFYLDENDKRPDKHIYILGKKDLFEEKENIIKYPYKLQNN